MDITLAKTFLAIVEAGSFKDAAEKLFVTQSTISMRVKALEQALGRTLFERAKSGTRLTPAGEQFQRHATALLRVWSHAQLEVALSDHHTDHMAVGGQISLWEGYLLKWVAWLHAARGDIAVTAKMGTSRALIEQLLEGSLDLAVVYRAESRPGLIVEHIFDDELVLVTSGNEKSRGRGRGYVFVNWGPEFAADHADTYPNQTHTSLHFDLGAVALSYLFDTQASGYFPRRLVRNYLEDDRLRLVQRARRFVYPVYAVYPEDHNADAYPQFLAGLRRISEELSG